MERDRHCWLRRTSRMCSVTSLPSARSGLLSCAVHAPSSIEEEVAGPPLGSRSNRPSQSDQQHGRAARRRSGGDPGRRHLWFGLPFWTHGMPRDTSVPASTGPMHPSTPSSGSCAGCSWRARCSGCSRGSPGQAKDRWLDDASDRCRRSDGTPQLLADEHPMSVLVRMGTIQALRQDRIPSALHRRGVRLADRSELERPMVEASRIRSRRTGLAFADVLAPTAHASAIGHRMSLLVA